MECISKNIRKIAQIINGGVEADPQNLSQQIRPVLTKMGINNFIEKNKTRLTGQTKEGLNLYCVQLRRETVITDDIINRIKREKNSFESMDWTAKAIEIYLWAEYKDPKETENPAQPVTPGIMS
jgi:hypothetical protein